MHAASERRLEQACIAYLLDFCHRAVLAVPSLVLLLLLLLLPTSAVGAPVAACDVAGWLEEAVPRRVLLLLLLLPNPALAGPTAACEVAGWSGMAACELPELAVRL